MHKTRAQFSAWTTFVRSIGLKATINLVRTFTRSAVRKPEEEQKVVFSDSRGIALSRLGVHFLPLSASIFAIGFNVVGFPNGPNISSAATLFLQVTAKLHEMAITGSLGLVVMHAIRYELINTGLSLGILHSNFALTGLNYLWSQEFWSVLTELSWNKRRLVLCLFIVGCCVLASVVGPASALLLIPSAAWQETGRTEYYLGGDEAELWPQRLSKDFVGPEGCLEPGNQTLEACLSGGMSRLLALFQQRQWVRNGYKVAMDDVNERQTITGFLPNYDDPLYNNSNHFAQETWALAARGDVSWSMNNLDDTYRISRQHASGLRRRLLDYVGDGLQISETKLPVGRVICGPMTPLSNDAMALSFPVLTSDQEWQPATLNPYDSSGPIADLHIEDLPSLFNTTTEDQARAKLVTLPQEFGSTTAGVVFVSSNSTYAVGRGCSVDFRWAVGQVHRESYSFLGLYTSHLGPPGKFSGNIYQSPNYQDFFHPYYQLSDVPTITADQIWLDTVFPISNYPSLDQGPDFTTFEILLQYFLADPGLTMSGNEALAWQSRLSLEYITVTTFADVLSRIGWYRSVDSIADANMYSNPLLQNGEINNSKIFDLRTVYAPPVNISYSTLTVKWQDYGWGWFLRSPGQYTAVAILSIYMIIVIVHSMILITSGWSCDAWDSMSELFVLALNSTPTWSDDELKNCSSGIDYLQTLRNRIKVVTFPEKQTTNKLELVLVDDYGVPRNGSKTDGLNPDIPYS